MLHVARQAGQLQISSLARSRLVRQLKPLSQSRSLSKSSICLVFKLSDDEIERIQEAAGESLRKKLLRDPQPYVKPDRRYRASGPYKMLEEAFETAETEELDSFVRGQLWEAYQNAKYRIKNLPTLLSERAWDILWKSQDTLLHDNPHRAIRLRKLSNDRERAGLGSTFPERLARLEALFASGSRVEALEQWSKEHNMISNATDDGHKLEHMDLGARMFITNGEFERAEEILLELYKMYPSSSPQTILDLFRTYVRKGDKSSLDKALELYLTMESRYGKRLSFEDCDACFHFFANYARPVQASRVFKDMVEKGHVAGEMTSAVIVQTLQRLRHSYQMCDNVKDVNEVFMNMLSALPLAYHSNLFKRWLMELAARKEIQAAPQVVELMYERGLQPRTVHFNLLVAVLLRSNDVKLCSQAESMAWQMLDQRHYAYSEEDAVTKGEKTVPQFPNTMTSKERRKYFAQPNVPFFLKRYIPRADAGTYAQLLQHYTKVNRFQDAESVLQRLHAWEQSTNDSSLTSHSPILLDAKAYYLLSSDRAPAVWSEILALGPTPPSARYNSALYFRLWRDLKNQILYHEDRYDPDLIETTSSPLPDPRPTPRVFLAHMTTWYTSHLTNQWERRKTTRRFAVLAQKYNTDIGTLVAASFKLAGDLPGALIAVEVLYHVFRIPPTESVIQCVLQQLVNLSVPSQTAEERRRGKESGRWETVMGRVARVYHLFLQKRLRAADEAHLSAQSMHPETDAVEDFFPSEVEVQERDGAQKAGIEVETLVELMRFMLEREVGLERAEVLISRAREEVCGTPEGVGNARGE